MPPHEIDLLEAQRRLEDESRAIGQARYRDQRTAPWVDAFGPSKDEGALPPGREMLRQAVAPTAEGVAAFLASSQKGRAGRRHSALALLADHDPDPAALAYLTLRCGIQAASQNLRVQKAAGMVARAIKDHLQAVSFDEVNPKGAAGLQRSLSGRQLVSAKRQQAIAEIHRNEGVALAWSQQEELQLGLKFLELAAEATDLFCLELIHTRKGGSHKREQQVQITDVALKWFEKQHSRCELLDPLPLPMVVPPRPWTDPFNGGYLTPPIGTRMIRSRTRPYQNELENIEMPDVYRAINAIQATGWRINRRLLEVIDSAVQADGHIGALPRQTPEVPPERPQDTPENTEALQAWKRSAAEVHQRNAKSKAKRLELAQRLWVARKLVDFPAIYFPHECDFRGRVYPVPQGGPHPQAGDIGRSLLEFAEGKPLGVAGARWLAIHVANVFGIDKVPFNERVAWVESHQAQIIDSAADPIDGGRFWTTADKPWTALAACFEWAGYVREGADFVSRLPIALDGSNSGLQHFTGLLRDADTAPMVNLVELDQPGDLYAVVARKAQAEVDASPDAAATVWQGERIIRRIVKRPCMTYVYSATAAGMADQIRAGLAELDEERAAKGDGPYLGGADNYGAASWLSHRLYRLIGETVPAARDAMKWLTGLSRTMTKADMPLWWTTPAGLPVLQRYPKTTSEKSEVTFRGKRMQLSLNDEAGPPSMAAWLEAGSPARMDGRASAGGIAPNFVHSLDAAHLMLTVNAAHAAGITDLALIHDSFGTHAADTDRLSAILRATFVTMYEGDPLTQFYAEALEQLADQPDLAAAVPSPPTAGKLDLRSVPDATYMFA